MLNIKYELIEKDYIDIQNGYIYTEDGKRYNCSKIKVDLGKTNKILMERKTFTISLFGKEYNIVKEKPIVYYVYDGFTEWN